MVDFLAVFREDIPKESLKSVSLLLLDPELANE